jgi:S1-C subfamily serine protease
MKATAACCSIISIACLLLGASVSIASPANPEERGPNGTIAYYIEVETSEPGIRIEADGELAGVSPLKVKVFGDRDGTFHHFKKAKYEIRAIPSRAGQFLQLKSYSTGGFFVPDDRIPSHLYFDMGTPADTAGAEAKPGSAPGPSQSRPVRRTGTGFFITDDGYFLTAFHLINGATNVLAKLGGQVMPALLVRKDPAADLALLKVEANSSGLRIGASKQARLGEHIYSMGFPTTELLGEEPKFTEGSISSLAGFQDDWSQFQISLPAYLGDSGSAVVNARGAVIAIVVAKVQGIELVNYAVKSSRASIMLDDLADLKLANPESGPDKTLSSEEIAETLKRSSVLVTAE